MKNIKNYLSQLDSGVIVQTVPFEVSLTETEGDCLNLRSHSLQLATYFGLLEVLPPVVSKLCPKKLLIFFLMIGLDNTFSSLTCRMLQQKYPFTQSKRMEPRVRDVLHGDILKTFHTYSRKLGRLHLWQKPCIQHELSMNKVQNTVTNVFATTSLTLSSHIAGTLHSAGKLHNLPEITWIE